MSYSEKIEDERFLKMVQLKKWNELRIFLKTKLILNIDEKCLKLLNEMLTDIKSDLLSILCDDFEPIITEIIKIDNNILSRFASLIYLYLDGNIDLNLIENLQILTSKSSTTEALILNMEYFDLPILHLLSRLDFHVYTEICSKLLECGLRVTILDLSSVYKQYGWCKIFEMMLEKDIHLHHHIHFNHTFSALPLMLGDFSKGLIEDFIFNDSNFELLDFDSFLHYTALPKFKKMYLKNAHKFMLPQALKILPRIPCLLELSRNSIHKYLVEKRKVRKYMDYKNIICKLPLPKICENILLYKEKLY